MSTVNRRASPPLRNRALNTSFAEFVVHCGSPSHMMWSERFTGAFVPVMGITHTSTFFEPSAADSAT